MAESKLDHTVSNSKLNCPGFDILWCDKNRNDSGVAFYRWKDLCLTQKFWIAKKLKIWFSTYFY